MGKQVHLCCDLCQTVIDEAVDIYYIRCSPFTDELILCKPCAQKDSC